ncbi:MAG TPA: hypothetical protein VM261_10135 [Kofleriaceae bacterium]|nr:hypothetical protein [Kofleriaceae bacterium]
MSGASRSRVALACIVASALVARATPAAAQPAGEDDRGPAGSFTGPPSIPRVGRTYSERIADELTLLGDTIDGHLGPLTLDSVKLKVDGRARKAHVRLAGESRYLSMTIHSDVHFRRGGAGVDTLVDLRVAGRALRFELPQFEVLPRSYLGERYVEVRVPIIKGTF